MADNILENRMFCVGEAWHTKGVRVNEALTSAEALKVAKLDYQVVKQDIYFKTNDTFQKIEDKFATVRENTKDALGVVGSRYNIVQNEKAFEFFDEVIKTKEAVYHSAGALGKGERVWLMAKLPKDIIVFGKDVINQYLLLTNSHNGTTPLKMYFTPIRVVCQNTLNQSLANSKSGISIRHTANVDIKINEARRVLGLALDFYDDFEVTVKAMANKKMEAKEISIYYDRVLKINDEEDTTTRKLNIKEDLIALQKNGQGNNIEEIKNTLWTTYNAVTEYVDHKRKNIDIESVLFGSGAMLKDTAYAQALELVKV